LIIPAVARVGHPVMIIVVDMLVPDDAWELGPL